MSYYPTPYDVPTAVQPGQWDGRDPLIETFLIPARRASFILFVLAGVSLVFGTCFGGALALMPLDEVLRQKRIAIPAELGLSPTQFIRIVGVALLILGSGATLIESLLGFLVRRGTAGWTVTALVINSLALVFFALYMVLAAVQQLTHPLDAILSLTFLSLPTGLLILVLVWLVRASHASAQIAAARRQQQMSWWHYQQQAIAAAQRGGYAQQPG